MTNATRITSPVWFSTPAQTRALTDAYASATWLTRMTGRYPLADDVACLKGLLTPWMKIATLLRAQGRLVLGPSTIAFEHKPYRPFGWRFVSADRDLHFTLTRDQILSIEAMDVPSPAMSAFDMKFTRIRTTAPAPLDDFLLTVGGLIAMPAIRARSVKMRDELIAWQASADGMRAPASTR